MIVLTALVDLGDAVLGRVCAPAETTRSTCSTVISERLMNWISRPRSPRMASSTACAGCPVATGAARLLVVGLDTGRQRPVPDAADVGLIDALAEGVGGDHDVRLPPS